MRAIADRAIVAGLEHGGDGPPLPERRDVPPSLWRSSGSFVTLHVDGALNGCIGAIETDEPLARDVARHAWSSAFEDPRLPMLTRADYVRLSIDISVLSPLAPLPAGSSGELIEALRTGVDGLLIEAGRSRAVFLPAVWTMLPSPKEFVSQLFRKAGLDPDTWPVDLRAWRFVTDHFGDAP